MGMHKKEYVRLIIATAIVGVVSIMVGQIRSQYVDSSEVRFSEASQHGARIVPASCASDPSNPSACSGTNSGCSLSANPSPVTAGGSTSFSWIIQPYSGAGKFPSGTVFNIQSASLSWSSGSVPVSGYSGSVSVSPSKSDTYVLTGYYALQPERSQIGIFSSGGIRVDSFRCVYPLTVCASGQTVKDGLCTAQPGVQNNGDGGNKCAPRYYCGNDGNIWYTSAQCSPSLFRQCQNGCVMNGSTPECVLIPGPRALQFRATPILVAKNGTSVVSWSVVNVAACTVTGSNGDRWSCTYNQCGNINTQTTSPLRVQTNYTLSCTPLRGWQGQWTSQTITIHIIPVFRET